MFILILLLSSGLTLHHVLNTWISAKKNAVTDITRLMQKRIDSYRFATWQIYENLAVPSPETNTGILQETRLTPDVYYLEKTRRKTESLIFGTHDERTLGMTLHMSNYLDSLWGAENNTWSMYFLNGQDNSLILISTLPLKDRAIHYKENAITGIVDARRAEMLQQANTLDERESFSGLRHAPWQNDRYFTIRTTFNQPGHLATIAAFDLPVNDLIPHTMPLENFQLRPITEKPKESENSAEGYQHSSVSLINGNVEIAVSFPAVRLQLVYRVPAVSLITDTLHNLLWPLLLNLLLLLLSLSGLIMLRQPALHPGENQSTELDALRMLNDEIVDSLPLGLLVYDFASNRTLVSNKIAEHLLPHINLQKIINMSDQHQGVLQVTVNNEIYEIRHVRSQLSPHTQLFMLRDQDRELLVNKKLQKAQQILEQNHQMRQQLLQNLGHALRQPLEKINQQLQSLELLQPNEHTSNIMQNSQALTRLVDDIVLLNQLETHDWAPDASVFNFQALLDEITLAILPFVQRKGLTFLVRNAFVSEEMRFGDHHTIRKILTTLLHYSLTTTQCGRISLDIDSAEQHPEKLRFQITDTGKGLTKEELGNSHFPFLGDTSQDRFGQASGLALFLCRQLCNQLGGQLEVTSKPDIGTRYTFTLYAPPETPPQQEEKLLDGVTVLTDITVDDIRKIVCHQLESWGAQCITPDERFSGQEHDVLVTDDPARLQTWALLLTEDEMGFKPINETQYRVNFNLSSALQDALLQLLEKQLAQETLHEESVAIEEAATPLNGSYYQLFVETVPEDVKKLYTEQADSDYCALAQTAHRLKGVFAMLNLVPGKQLCETLEQYIKECDDSNIKKTTSDIDNYVNELLQQGNQ